MSCQLKNKTLTNVLTFKLDGYKYVCLETYLKKWNCKINTVITINYVMSFMSYDSS